MSKQGRGADVVQGATVDIAALPSFSPFSLEFDGIQAAMRDTAALATLPSFKLELDATQAAIRDIAAFPALPSFELEFDAMQATMREIAAFPTLPPFKLEFDALQATMREIAAFPTLPSFELEFDALQATMREIAAFPTLPSFKLEFDAMQATMREIAAFPTLPSFKLEFDATQAAVREISAFLTHPSFKLKLDALRAVSSGLLETTPASGYLYQQPAPKTESLGDFEVSLDSAMIALDVEWTAFARSAWIDARLHLDLDQGYASARAIHLAVCVLEELLRQRADLPTKTLDRAVAALSRRGALTASEATTALDLYRIRSSTPGAAHGVGQAPAEVAGYVLFAVAKLGCALIRRWWL